jgi:hypothetical protein
MNIKSGLVCLSIIAIMTFSLSNVAAASVGKPAINIHSSYAMDAPVKTQTALVLALSNNKTVVGTPVDIVGALAAKEHDTIHYIGGATITIQQLGTNGTTWNTIGTVQTLSKGNETGFFGARITPKSSGYYIVRVIYDGDSNYAPAVSNVVALTVN